MDIARAAHRGALRDMQPPPAPRIPIPGLTHTGTPAPPPRDAIFGQLFALISRSVRQTMLLQDRLATGTIDHPTPNPTPGIAQPPPSQQPAPDGTRTHADRLYQEPFEDECLQDTGSVEDILLKIRSELDAGVAPGLAPHPHTPEPARTGRRPIPLIPPGPEPALSAQERSALAYHRIHPPKPPD